MSNDTTALSGCLMLAASVLAIGGAAVIVGMFAGAGAGIAAFLMLLAVGTAALALAVAARGGGD
ncbi:MAG: hypothetical protein IJ092_10250 [Atopobiaceae bacterium]|nr:hypothetical protein [Atopobiaceae bacterium]